MFPSPRDEVIAPLRRNFLLIGAAGAVFLTLCTLAGFCLVRRKILKPLSILGAAARSISTTAKLRRLEHIDEKEQREQRAMAQGSVKTIMSVRTGDEIEALVTGDLAAMTSRVLRHNRELEAEVSAMTAVIREDLELASEFQNALLPSRYPEVPPVGVLNPLKLQFPHFYQPASTVGGDLFDFLLLNENRAAILIADVMGHGARSALVTAILRALVRNHSEAASDPGNFLTELSSHLHEVISRSYQTLFVTAFFLSLDTLNGRASRAVAGHPPPLRVRRGSLRSPMRSSAPRERHYLQVTCSSFTPTLPSRRRIPLVRISESIG
jgi:sigma-B regulation protein RsbU (phosphoserine phosphatase)